MIIALFKPPWPKDFYTGTSITLIFSRFSRIKDIISNSTLKDAVILIKTSKHRRPEKHSLLKLKYFKYYTLHTKCQLLF